tara:strand:- start:18000 stop:18194 length:195 start_codon:yes stop_codon:yes gene_type:complete
MFNPKDKIVISVLIHAIADAIDSELNDLSQHDMSKIIQDQLDHENDYEVDELLEDYITSTGREI